jgi:2-phospho-L-lactate guanylyltransferase (CobY/MobA/RfbA family)
MSDLPQLTVEDLSALLAHKAEFVVAPDVAETGSNALRLCADPVRSTAFGRVDSFRRHVSLGAAVLRRPGLARDVDLPEHLEFL